uniref:Serine aminopeptidase S33 domain-containing protein n=1 Tax=Branchiostoma floridae TaxID=7739 RepID=C3Y5N4_BRAFL|eukprot:XP_002608271.1 hypothetical protein BRAFLDRAFT_59838 [Branchiostoma floridae]
MATSGEDTDRCTPQGVSYSTLPHMVNADGRYLHCKTWEPPGSKPRALLMIAHGLDEHIGWYDDFAQFLTGHNILVFSHDHIGHGQSEGERADVKDFNILVRDTLQHVDMIVEKYPDTPVYILGYSMGGPVSILAACERPQQFAGVLLIGPAIKPFPGEAPGWKNRKIQEDPLCFHGGLKLRTAAQILTGMQKVQSQVDDIEWPFLVMHGEDDQVVNSEGSKMLHEKARSLDKTMKVDILSTDDCFSRL